MLTKKINIVVCSLASVILFHFGCEAGGTMSGGLWTGSVSFEEQGTQGAQGGVWGVDSISITIPLSPGECDGLFSRGFTCEAGKLNNNNCGSCCTEGSHCTDYTYGATYSVDLTDLPAWNDSGAEMGGSAAEGVVEGVADTLADM